MGVARCTFVHGAPASAAAIVAVNDCLEALDKIESLGLGSAFQKGTESTEHER